MKRSLEAAGLGLLAAGAVLARRCRRDLALARRRLAELDRRTVETSAGTHGRPEHFHLTPPSSIRACSSPRQSAIRAHAHSRS